MVSEQRGSQQRCILRRLFELYWPGILLYDSPPPLADLIDGNIKMILSLLWPLIVASYTGEIVYVDGMT